MDALKISIDRLGSEKKAHINETLPPSFLDIHDDDLEFKEPIAINIEAYLAEDHLIAHLSAKTTALLPCNICNTPVVTPIHIKNLCVTVPLSEISSSEYDFSEEVRENVLLQTPLFTECEHGNCPERAHLKQFLKTEEIVEEKEPDVHFPFATELFKDLSLYTETDS